MIMSSLSDILKPLLMDEGTRLVDRHYLKTVKRMEYNEMVDVLHRLDYGIDCFISSEYVEFSECGDYKNENENENANYYTEKKNEEGEFPIVIKESKTKTNKVLIFKAISEIELVEAIVSTNKTTVIFLPIVVEAFSENDMWHQMTFVIDLKNSKMFFYDPNGINSRYCKERIHNLFERYASLVNTSFECYGKKQCEYIRYQFHGINHELKGIGGHHCVVATTMFIVAYNQLTDIEVIDTLLKQIQKVELSRIYIALYNTLGMLLYQNKK